jgi:hypothetical protein
MGNYCWINAHYPIAGLSAEEQSFLADLRKRIPKDDEWLSLGWDEQERRREAANTELGIPGQAGDWRMIEQSQQRQIWYVSGSLPTTLTPPFPSVLSRYHPPYSKNCVPPVWRTAFSAPGRWNGEWSIFQTLQDTREHTKFAFGQLWKFLYSDSDEIQELRRKAPPCSIAHERLRAVFCLFRLSHFVQLQREVLAVEHPPGTVLELDLLDAVYEQSEFADYMDHADVFLPLLEALAAWDVKSVENSSLLVGRKAYEDDLNAWLYASDCDSTEMSSYLLQDWEDK